MTKREREDQQRMYTNLQSLGFTFEECEQLRRISMTLRRWHELECGDGNEYGSWAIERDDNGDGKPFMVHHHYRHGQGKDYTTRTPIADRETGARKRLAKIITARNKRTVEGAQEAGSLVQQCGRLSVASYIQTDPRGAALYILRPGDVPQGQDPSAYYSRGICVY